MTKAEEYRLNKFVWACDVQHGNRENPAIETENSVQFTRQALNNRTIRENSLIGAKSSHNTQDGISLGECRLKEPPQRRFQFLLGLATCSSSNLLLLCSQ
ncbi:MAG: hypothetical protein HRU33_11560 [Rhodobacteraceae bacterium]|nr:hypothetical protein [Paracoccaceae bacterium]